MKDQLDPASKRIGRVEYLGCFLQDECIDRITSQGYKWSVVEMGTLRALCEVDAEDQTFDHLASSRDAQRLGVDRV